MPAADRARPYAGLSPARVLDALDAVGLRGDGRLLQLNSYENRVFQAFLEDGRVVVAKFYRPARWTDEQILEEHAFAAALADGEVPIAAPWALALDDRTPHAAGVALVAATLARLEIEGQVHRYAVTGRVPGRAPEIEDLDTLEWIGRYVGRIHAIGARGRFAHRPTLDVDTFGEAPRTWLLESGLVPPDALPAWREVTARALERVRAHFDAAGDVRVLRLHGDCHLGNVLWTATGPHFVDLDDAVNGPAMQDLWMLLSGDRGSRTRQLDAVLAGYRAFADLDARELPLVEALRTLRIVHHSAWLARRWDDPAFPVAFPWFASPAYWADQTTRLREQLEAMDEPPLAVGG
jgi:Ser/Thr protein kinase RdoA (MazF antagonist)